MLHHLFDQRLGNQFTCRKNSTDEGNLKALVIHFQFVNDGDRCFAKLFAGVSENFARDVVAITGGLNTSLL